MQMTVHCERMGEHAWLLRLGEVIDATLNARVQCACTALSAANLAAIEDLVPAYASILLRLKPTADEAQMEAVREQACAIIAGVEHGGVAPSGELHCIPVCYESDCAPDMAVVERITGLSREQIISLHCQPQYPVAMLGFAPGFAYLLGLDDRLQVPRRAQPRVRVAAGSVAIGGAQTGIYPTALPGGWQLIGRTPLAMFDATDGLRPCRLVAGDLVRFEPIDEATFRRMQAAA